MTFISKLAHFTRICILTYVFIYMFTGKVPLAIIFMFALLVLHAEVMRLYVTSLRKDLNIMEENQTAYAKDMGNIAGVLLNVVIREKDSHSVEVLKGTKRY